jgi:hypothetical protein
MLPNQENVEPVEIFITDRAYDDASYSAHLLPLSSLEDTTQLVDTWLKLQSSKSKSDLRSVEWRALETAYLKHLEWRFDYPKKVLQQQLIFAWFMTLIVTVLILSGLIFAFLQLKSALAVADFSNTETELAIQTAGTLSFRSSLVGAIVLIISLLFFYLYLRYVFSNKSPIPPHMPLTKTDAPSLFGRRMNKTRKGRQRTQSGGRNNNHETPPRP